MYYIAIKEDKGAWVIVGNGFLDREQAKLSFENSCRTYGTASCRLFYHIPTQVTISATVPEIRSSITEMRIGETNV